MAIVHDTVRQYNQALSQWAVVRLNSDGTFTRINPLADIDEATLHGGHFFDEVRDKITGYQNEKSEVGAVLCVGVWRRLEAADTPELATVWAEGGLVADHDALHLRDVQAYSAFLAAKPDALQSEIDAAIHAEQAVDPDSPGTVPGIGEPAEPDPDEGKEPEPDPEPEPEPTPEPQPPQVDYGPAVQTSARGRYSNGSSWFETTSIENSNLASIPSNWFAEGKSHGFARFRFRADGKFRLYFRDNDGTNDLAGSGTSDPLAPDLLGKLKIRISGYSGGVLQTYYETTLPESAVKTNFYSWDEPLTPELSAAVADVQSFAQAGYVMQIILIPPGAED